MTGGVLLNSYLRSLDPDLVRIPAYLCITAWKTLFPARRVEFCSQQMKNSELYQNLHGNALNGLTIGISTHD
jgi:hypothetical protein